jgi:hypothetical protein
MASRAEAPRHPRRTGRYRLRVLAPWLAGLVLAAGVVAAVIAFLPSHHAQPTTATAPLTGATASKPAPAPKTVPLGKEPTAVARKFVTTAVARKNLAAAWKISDANIRGGLTYKEWLSGNIPVVPFPVSSSAVTRFKIDFSYANEAGLEILLEPQNAKGMKPQVFFIRLKKVGGSGSKRWVVDTWVPHSTPLVPLGANH